jgi:Fur family transcriptional regulator, peroxide stress response regulator
MVMIEIEPRFISLVEKLKTHGYRITPQRAMILKIITEDQNHPSAEQIYDHVRSAFPMTSLATVYKTIAMLKDENEILELGFAGNSSRYDGLKPYPHPHLICVKCQKIVDPDIELFGDLPGELAQKYGYQIVNQRVDFFGICPSCQEIEARKAENTER